MCKPFLIKHTKYIAEQFSCYWHQLEVSQHHFTNELAELAFWLVEVIRYD
jgi:hypothetical protein